MSKRVFTMLIVLTMVMASLSGCFTHRDSSGRPSSSGSSTGATTVPSVTDETQSSEATCGMSYNFLLYADRNTSLSTPVTADTFGLLTSAYTDNADRRLATGTYVGTPIHLSQEHLSQFVDWIDAQQIPYTYAELYDLDNASQALAQYADALSSQGHIHTDLIVSTNQIPSSELIASTIERNSQSFLKNHSGYYQLDQEYITLLATIFSEVLEAYYDVWSQEDLERIYCMLNNVAAAGIDSGDFTVNDLKTLYFARVTDDGVIMLDLTQMEALRGDNVLERTLTHEIIHIFQRMCADHRLEGLTQIGSSQYIEAFDEAGKVNSLHYQWLYEASAERMSMDLYGADTPLVYKNMVGYLNTLDLITLLRPEYSSDSLEVSQLSVDPDAVYALFGAATREEKAEIANMLFSICYIQNDRDDFVAAYEAAYGSITGQETTIKRVMKQSVAKTMTKYFYKNLAERIANADVTLQDAFYLINVFEAALNLHLVYDDESRYDLNEAPLRFYLEVQDQFFTLVAQDSGMTVEELINSLKQYALVIQTDEVYQRNCSFTWLTEKEKAFIYQVLTTDIQSLTINIRSLPFLQFE